MRIQEAPLPPEIRAAIPELLMQITEYLELEEGGFSPREVKYSCYLTVDDSVGFVVFDYTTDDGSPFVFFQYSLDRGVNDSGSIGCWPRTEGETLAWSIAEYLQMNPLGDE